MTSTIEWRPISEAKKDGTEYLLATGPGVKAVAGYWDRWGTVPNWKRSEDAFADACQARPLKNIRLFSEFPVVPE
jgi:hypothetical protein